MHLLLPSSGRIALMMEAARTSETLANFYETTRRYNPDDSHLSLIFSFSGSEVAVVG
jgi:hypothetical protein